MPETLGQRIRRLREAKKLGLRETAKKLDISPAYLSRIETNEEKTPPGEVLIHKLADLLEDNFDELMSLAGRVPIDVQQFITKAPGLPQFLRTMRDKGIKPQDVDLDRIGPKRKK